MKSSYASTSFVSDLVCVSKCLAASSIEANLAIAFSICSLLDVSAFSEVFVSFKMVCTKDVISYTLL